MNSKWIMVLIVYASLFAVPLLDLYGFENNTIPNLNGIWKVEIEEKEVSCGLEKSGLEKYLWEVVFQQRGYTIWAKLVAGERVNDGARGYTFAGIVKEDKVLLFGTGGPDCAYNSFVNGTLSGSKIVGEFIGGDCFCNDFGIYKATKIK